MSKLIQLTCSWCACRYEKPKNNYTKAYRDSNPNFFCSVECRSKFNSVDYNPDKRKKSIDKFWSKVDKSAGLGPASMGRTCWEWLLLTDGWGYGNCDTPLVKGTTKAHRISYILTYGDFDRSLFVCHKCDNPKCVRPDHLFLGTPKDNADDMTKKGRNKPQKGEKNPFATFTNQEVLDLREEYSREPFLLSDRCRDLGVSNCVLYNALRGRTYAHLPGAVNIVPVYRDTTGENNSNAKLYQEDADKIRQYKIDNPQKYSHEIKQELNIPCDSSEIRRILQGKHFPLAPEHKKLQDPDYQRELERIKNQRKIRDRKAPLVAPTWNEEAIAKKSKEYL